MCTCAVQLCCELTAVNRLHQLCSSLRYNYSTFLICFSGSPSMVLCHFDLILCVFIGDFSHSDLQLFTHSLQSLPSITCSMPKDLKKNKRTKMMESSLEPVPSCPIVPSDSTVQYHVMEHPKPKHIAHTVYCWTRNAHHSGPLRQSLTLQSIINIKCVFVYKKFEITKYL